MGKIAWITDSATGLSMEEAEQMGVYLVPVQMSFGEETFRVGVDISLDEFYRRLANKEIPTTSQPSPGEFIKLYEELKQKGYEQGIAIHMSSGFSGTIHTSKLAADTAGFPLTTIDSKMASFPMQQMIKDALEMEKQGRSAEEIIRFLQNRPDDFQVYILLDDLQFIHRGGRMNAAEYLIGSLLQIKPIVSFYDGKAGVYQKVRTYKKAKSCLFELLQRDAAADADLIIAVVHANNFTEAAVWKKELAALLPKQKVEIVELGSTVGVHVGPGVTGLAWMKKVC